MPRLALAAAALALSALAGCSDGTGPERTTGPGAILVLRTENSRQSLWAYEGAAPRRVTADSMRFIFSVARARDGRTAWITMNATSASVRYGLVEVSPAGAVLRSVRLGEVSEMYGPPSDLAYSPDGTRLAWRSARDGFNDSLLVLDAASTTPRGLAARKSVETTPDRVVPAPAVRWTPGGRVVFGPPGALVAYHPGSGDTLWLARNLGAIRDYDFTQDGRLAVVSFASTATTARILAQRVSGGTLIQVPGSSAADPLAVRWTLDGQRVATTARDSVFLGGQWRHFGVPQLMELDASAEPARISGVAIGGPALHGWTRDGRLIVTGYDPTTLGTERDVYLGAFGQAATNLTSTPSADEFRALPLP